MTPLELRTSSIYAIKARVAITAARLACLLPPDRMQLLVGRISRGARPATAAEAAEAREIVCALSQRCAGQGCVQRSIAVVLLCRLHGRSPNWRTGFGTEPFTAHAWVEVEGLPIGEPEAVARYFVAHAVDVQHIRASPA